MLVRHHGSTGPLLKASDRGIAVDAYDQHVPQRPCRLEIPDVPDVKQVEAAVRKHHTGALFSLSSQEGKKFLYGDDVCAQNQQARSFSFDSLRYSAIIPRLQQKSQQDPARPSPACATPFQPITPSPLAGEGWDEGASYRCPLEGEWRGSCRRLCMPPLKRVTNNCWPLPRQRPPAWDTCA